MPEHLFVFPSRRDPVYSLALIASAVAFTIAISLIIARPTIVHKLVLPLAIPIYSSDGVFTLERINTVGSILTSMIPVALLIMCLSLCYAFIWRYFSLHLCINQRSSPPTLTTYPSSFELSSLFLILTIAFILSLHNLTRSLVYDEIVTAMRFVEVNSIWTTVTSAFVFNNHIAYSILAFFSQSIFGRHEWSLRLPALLLSLTSICWLWAFTRHFLGPKMAIIAALFLAISPLHAEWGVSARGYSGMILFALMSSYFYLKLVRAPSYWDGIIYILVSVAGIYFHLYAAFVTIVQIIHLIYLSTREVFGKNYAWHLDRDSFRILWVSYVSISCLSLILYAPILPELIYYIFKRRHGIFNVFFPLDVINMLSGGVWKPLVPFIFLLSVLGLIVLWRSCAKEASYFALLLIFPLLTVWMMRPFDLYERFFSYYLPYYILLLVSGFFALWHFAASLHRKGSTYLLRLLCIGLTGYVLYSWPSSIRRYSSYCDWCFREVAHAMNSDAVGSVALCVLGGGANLFQYYSERKILLPESMDVFNQIINTYPEVRCAYNKGTFVPVNQQEMVSFLAHNAVSHNFGETLVFTYRTMPTAHDF